MISQVSIQNLRGIEAGTVSGLTPLSILTGVNGSGKSTVLDALYIGAALAIGDSIARVVRRRITPQASARWLFRRLAASCAVEVVYAATDGQARSRSTSLLWHGPERAQSMTVLSPAHDWLGVVEAKTRLGGVAHVNASTNVLFGMDGDDEVVGRDELELPLPEIELVDMRGPESQRPLTDVFSEASVSDRIDWVNGLLAQVIPDFRRLEIIGVGSGFEVAVNAKGGTVPLSLSGDGLRALARLGLELSAASMGTVLLEEPEVHQHPRSLRQSATVIVEAVKRGVQVVVATHSLELIDELLLAAAAGGSIDALSVQKLRLQGGVLRTTSFSGNESDRIRNEIGTELR